MHKEVVEALRKSLDIPWSDFGSVASKLLEFTVTLSRVLLRRESHLYVSCYFCQSTCVYLLERIVKT